MFLNKLLYAAIFVVCSLCANAQEERKNLNGKVKSTFDGLEGIYVINETANVTVTTSRGGYFTISAKAKDTILFSSVQFVSKKVVIEEKDTESDLMIVELQTLVTELEEVVIENYNNISAESLGIVPKGQKQYTPAEKKLLTASSMKMNPMGLDPVINAITGRTKMLKKALETERKEDLMAKINYVYTEDEIINEFKIPQEYVNGFIYYAAEDKEFARAIKEKNDGMAKFYLSGLALKYLEIISEEDEK